MYYDINHQYGYALSRFFSGLDGGFQFLSDVNIDVASIVDDYPEGYILEVDLQYPHHLHDAHKDVPFCPEHIDPKSGKPPVSWLQITKLMASLNRKYKYIIHYRALKEVLQHGR